MSKENTNGSGLSSQSSSSGVLVPGVDDKDLDWDEDMDLNGDDITEEEVKKIMQDISSSKQKGQDQEDGDLDVSYMSLVVLYQKLAKQNSCFSPLGDVKNSNIAEYREIANRVKVKKC